MMLYSIVSVVSVVNTSSSYVVVVLFVIARCEMPSTLLEQIDASICLSFIGAFAEIKPVPTGSIALKFIAPSGMTCNRPWSS